MASKNKWLMALAGMTLQLSIGSIYAYSVWIKPIELLNGWDAHQLKFAFSLAICFLGLTAAFMGKFVHRVGPKKAGLLGALFFGVGLAGAGFANSIGSLPVFYLFYGVVSGIGLGFGYITPVSVVVQWFPDKPGFASGLVIMSFAAGSILASQIISPLTASLGVSNTFYTLALAYSILMVLASLYLAVPSVSTGVVDYHSGGANISASELLKDIRFYGLWFMLFFNTTCGIALIAVAAPMAKDVIHITEAASIIFVGIIGLFNGLGRLIWSSVSDKIGRWSTFMCFYIIGTICFITLTQTTNALIFQIAVFVVISCYGGAFATIPAFIKDIYGSEKLGSVLGYVLIAWSAAAFVGPWLITLSSDYTSIFWLFSGILAITAIMAFFLKSKMVNTESATKIVKRIA
ncbi:L-lactate MFS transporter [Arcticibacter tournemirensis]|uniref:MFS transporter n=1 Tax=Arcticibacter tournemirensis TaxID=699437 RepID=A0A4Q0M3M7_9SPHI|nr:OFA family MFS transporter [Arcticibacter tournemirensis]RXF67455.1 MFS transporter [Arcticibacter tournemirensis]